MAFGAAYHFNNNRTFVAAHRLANFEPIMQLLAMTQSRVLAVEFARVLQKPRPSSKRGRRECRVFCAPAASRAMRESTRASHHRYAETVRHSLHDGVNACCVLSPVSMTF